MDKLDKGILSLLLEDGRLKYRDVAKRLNISTSVAFYRVKRLFEQGTIERVAAIISDRTAGIEITAIISINIEKENLLEFEKSIANNRNICAVYDITGEYDAILIGKFRNKGELDYLIKELRGIKSVRKTNTSIVLNTIKEDFIFKGVE